MIARDTACIAFNNVTLALAGREILRDINFEIGRNEFIGLFGANGAGKTSLLRAILGVLPVQHGSIRVFGEAARCGNPLIGYLAQARSHLHSGRLRGYDIVASVVQGEKLGVPLHGAALKRKVDRALGLVDATALARRPFSEISGGERQRVLLAQALVGEPQLLLLDEPLLNLDPGQQRNVIGLVKDLQIMLGLPVIFSSHELNPLLCSITRVLYLGQAAAAIGSVDEVITAPILSRLYDTPIEVHKVAGRIFVMSGNVEIERDPHRHEHDHGTQAHHHV